MSLSPGTKLLATAGVDGIVYLRDIRTSKLVREIKGHPERTSAPEFSHDGKRLVTGGFSELTEAHPVTLIVCDVATGVLPAEVKKSSAGSAPPASNAAHIEEAASAVEGYSAAWTRPGPVCCGSTARCTESEWRPDSPVSCRGRTWSSSSTSATGATPPSSCSSPCRTL